MCLRTLYHSILMCLLTLNHDFRFLYLCAYHVSFFRLQRLFYNRFSSSNDDRLVFFVPVRSRKDLAFRFSRRVDFMMVLGFGGFDSDSNILCGTSDSNYTVNVKLRGTPQRHFPLGDHRRGSPPPSRSEFPLIIFVLLIRSVRMTLPNIHV